jgi:hypothetical protein
MLEIVKKNRGIEIKKKGKRLSIISSRKHASKLQMEVIISTMQVIAISQILIDRVSRFSNSTAVNAVLQKV